MADVVYLNGEEVLSDLNRNEGCVDALERMLQKAKDGEIIGFAAALQYRDGSNSGTQCGFVYDNRLVGCLMGLVTKISLRD